MKFPAILLSLLVPVCAAIADQDPRIAPSHYFTGYLGTSLTILGSEDTRAGGAFGYAFGRLEPRFAYGDIKAQLVYEGYVDHTQSGGANGDPENNTYAFGGLAYGRWRWQVDRFGNGMYFDLGWGFQYANHVTNDLDSQINSTPVMDVGGTFRSGPHEYFLGLRFLHISDAGLRGKNAGQNELYLMLGVRY